MEFSGEKSSSLATYKAKEEEMVRIGIIGMGYRIGIAKQHIQGYKTMDQVQITALYDVNPEHCEEYKQRFQLTDAKVCSSLEELFSLVDGVSICTPNYTHLQIAQDALQHHVAVLCEKPFSNGVDGCEQIVALAKQTDAVDMIGLCYRGIPAFRLLKEYVDAGFFGKIYYIRTCQGGGRIASVDVKREWRMDYDKSGAGAMADFGSHMVDIVDGLFSPVIGKYQSVQAMSTICINQRTSESSDAMETVDNDDVAAFNIKTDKGVIISFTASRVGSSHQLEVFGENGYAFFDGQRPLELVISKKDANQGAGGKTEVVPTPDAYNLVCGKVPEQLFSINFVRQMEEFVAAIEEHRKTPINFERGLYIQRVLAAIETSSKLGQTVTLDC